MSDIDELFNQINPEDHPPIPAQQDVHQILNDNASANMVSCFTYVSHPYKRVHMSQKLKNEIFVDLNRAGHDKSVEKKISVLAQIFTKLWSIYELHNYIILIIILNIII